MNDYLDSIISFQEERVRHDRKAFLIQTGVMIFNIAMTIANGYFSLNEDKTISLIAAGMCLTNCVWCLAFFLDFSRDYFVSKKYLDELCKMRGAEIIKLDKNVIKMKP